MFELEEFTLEDLPEDAAPIQERLESWKQWADLETKRRSIFALFIIDAQLARYHGGLPIGKHVLNPLQSAAPHAVFHATTVDEWSTKMRQQWKDPHPLREIYNMIFESKLPRGASIYPFTISVLLEGIQAVILERNFAGGDAVGVVSEAVLVQALLTIKTKCLGNPEVPIGNLELHIRWKALCLDLIVDTVKLFRQLGGEGPPQNIFGVGQKPTIPSEGPNRWTQSPKGRRALLFAIGIQDLAERLPVGRVTAPSMPPAVFSAATIYCAYCRAGQADVVVPQELDWAIIAGVEGHNDGPIASKCRQFIETQRLQPGFRRLNLRHSLYQFQAMLRAMSTHWGIAEEMRQQLYPWTSFGSE
ncbi:uncharacterized protein A1O9_07920 [Exophiala aquamarina CBS 119918]|uniref:Transcription factor domain-containing protein n=1 Tax=Exophiala aquamarina CBS 119918 TaxID=1182545 RepID=A0A072P8D2_9EURO|nr:uncharacterized protein A1O9_07920 [Exophiala aquamarina CBS 119918]KEF56339.1 hypothetical protein A1O9_07920 [Exophiala aquamarina CBS 119918]